VVDPTGTNFTGVTGTKLTGVTSNKVQILTPDERQASTRKHTRLKNMLQVVYFSALVYCRCFSSVGADGLGEQKVY
jgi:hypothetical protein